MNTSIRGWVRLLEVWCPHLFGVAAVCLLLGASNNGLTLLTDGHAFDEWVGIVLELGRLTALLGAAALSAQLLRRTAWLGAVSTMVASLAVMVAGVLIGVMTLRTTGLVSSSPGLLGIGTYVLSVGTFTIVGAGLVWTGEPPARIGALLLANTVVLLVVFFGRLVVPFGVVATVGPGVQVLLYGGLAYALRRHRAATHRTAAATETAP